MLKRELRVAFSPRVQPVWVRIVKWILIVGVIVRFHNAQYFWPGVVMVVAAALALHFFYRWKTQGWTRAWGGWNDLGSGQ